MKLGALDGSEQQSEFIGVAKHAKMHFWLESSNASLQETAVVVGRKSRLQHTVKDQDEPKWWERAPLRHSGGCVKGVRKANLRRIRSFCSVVYFHDGGHLLL